MLYISCGFPKNIGLLYIFIPVTVYGIFTLHSLDIIYEQAALLMHTQMPIYIPSPDEILLMWKLTLMA